MSMAIWRKAALAALALAAMNAALAAEQALSPTADPERRVEIPLIIGTLENGVSEAGVIRLPQEHVQVDPQYIAMEAEEATSIAFADNIFSDPEGLRGADPEASGGRFICRISEVRYRFKVTQPGNYVVWTRLWAPGPGGWCRTESMDDASGGPTSDDKLKNSMKTGAEQAGGGPRSVVDISLQPGDPRLKQWIWVKPALSGGGEPCRYELSAGWHELKFNYEGGIRLDKLILTRDPAFTPEGLAPLAMAGEGPATGTLVTDDIKPKGVRQWLGLIGTIAPAGGVVAMRYSTDGGAQWTAFTDLAAIRSLAVTGDGSDRLRFKFELTRPAGQTSPALQGLALAYLSAVRQAELAPLTALPEAIRDSSGRAELAVGDKGGCLGTAADYQLPDRVWRMEPGQALVFEAEAYTAARFHPDELNSLRDDPSASGGKAIYQFPHERNQLRYDFSVPEAGSYRVWYRIRFDQLGQWSAFHFASMDGMCQNREAIELPKGYKPADDWVFVPGPVYHLPAGQHTFNLHGRFDYSHLDQIAVLPETAKPAELGLTGNGPFADSAAAPQEFAVMRMAAVRPSAVKAWKAVGLDAELNGGELLVKVSADGATWRPLAELAKLPAARGDGSDTLHVRIALRRAAGKPSPVLKSAWVDYDAGGVPELTLKNAALELRFSPEGQLMGVRDVKNARWLLPQAAHQPLFELKARVPGEASLRPYQQADAKLIARRYERTADGQKLSFTYGLLDSALQVTCSVTLNDGAALADWDLGIVNDSPLEVREFTYPRLRGLRLGASELDDMAAWNATVGEIFPNPGAGGVDWVADARYPGDAGMPWVYYFDPAGGLYLCSRDPSLTATDLIHAPGAYRGSWDMTFTKHAYVPTGKSVQFNYQIGVGPGDWHWAADNYHAWFYSWNEKPKFPDWVVTNPGWNAGPVHHSGRLYRRMATHWWPNAEWMGIRHFQAWGSTADNDSCGFWNHFNPYLGSQQDMAAGNAALDKLGAHFGGYLNIQGWSDEYRRDPNFVGCTPKRHFSQESLDQLPPLGFGDRGVNRYMNGKRQEGGPGLNAIPPAKQFNMCRGDSRPDGWNDHLLHWCADVNAGEYGCDIVYLDQTSCTAPFLCYNDKHGHGKDHGSGGRQLAELLKTMNERGRKHNPDFAIGVEGMVDAHALHAAFNLFVGSEQNKGDLFLYTHPWASYYRGSSNGGGFDPIPNDHKFALLFLHVRLDGVGESEAARAAVAVRERTGDWFYRGRFRDNVGLSVDKPDIVAKWFETQTTERSGALVNLANLNLTAGATATLTAKGLEQVTHALLFKGDHTVDIQPVVRTGGTLRFPVPATLVSAALLINRAPAAEALQVVAVRPMKAGSDRLDVFLVNTTAETIAAKATIAASPDLTLSESEFTATVPAHALVRRSVPLSELAQRTTRSTAKVGVSWGWFWSRKHAAATALLAPPVVNGGFEVDNSGTGVADAWGTTSAGLFHEIQQFSVDSPAPSLGLDGERDTLIKHGGTASLKLRGRMTFTWRDMAGTALADNPHFKAKSGKPFTWSPDANQNVILKSDTEYRLNLWLRTDAKPQRDILIRVRHPLGDELGGLNLKTLKDADACVGEWKRYSIPLKPTRVGGAYHLEIWNDSDQTLWVDDLAIEEVRAVEPPPAQAAVPVVLAITPSTPAAKPAAARQTVDNVSDKARDKARDEGKKRVGEDGIPDFTKANAAAIGVVMGDAVESFQLYPQVDGGTEGIAVKRAAQGRSGWAIVPTPKEQKGTGSRFLYFTCFKTPDEYRVWKGQAGVRMAIEYYDGSKGSLAISYPRADKTWGHLAPESTGLTLKGDGAWRTVAFDLADPTFNAQFRVEINNPAEEQEAILLGRVAIIKVEETW